MQTICTLLHTDKYTNISSFKFLPNALAKPTVSKQRRQEKLNVKWLVTKSLTINNQFDVFIALTSFFTYQ